MKSARPPFPAAPRTLGLWTLGLWTLAGMDGTSCSVPDAAQLTEIVPERIAAGAATQVHVRGQNLRSAVRLSLDSPEAAERLTHWQVQIGGVSLPVEQVQWEQPQGVFVTVPNSFAVGSHAVSVVTPSGQLLRLGDPLTIYASAEDGGDAGAPSPTVGEPRDGGAGVTRSISDSGYEPPLPVAAPDASRPAVPDASRPAEPDSGSTSPAQDASPSLIELTAALSHRYRFDSPGTTAVDSVGSADGIVVGTSLDGVSGAVSLNGSGAYVDLPNGLISGRSSVTIESWLYWSAPADVTSSEWQRVFDFGSNPAAEGEQGNGIDTHLYFSPRASGINGTSQVSFRGNGTGSQSLNGDAPLPRNSVQHIAVVFDGPGRELTLYTQGVPTASRTLPFALSTIEDENNWLGRSQVLGDPDFEGRILEFRIYGEPLDADAIALSFGAGPDANL